MCLGMGLHGYTATRDRTRGESAAGHGPRGLYNQEIKRIRGSAVQSRKTYCYTHAQVTCAACAHRTAESTQNENMAAFFLVPNMYTSA